MYTTNVDDESKGFPVAYVISLLGSYPLPAVYKLPVSHSRCRECVGHPGPVRCCRGFTKGVETCCKTSLSLSSPPVANMVKSRARRVNRLIASITGA